MDARTRVLRSALLVVAVLGPVFYVAGLAARGLVLLQTGLFRLSFAHVMLAISAAASAYLLFQHRGGMVPLRVIAGFALAANLGSVVYAGCSWMNELDRLAMERTLVPIEPMQVGILVAPLDEEPLSRQESQAMRVLLAEVIRRDGLSDYVDVRHVYPVSTPDQARRLGEKMRANVVVWKGRESVYQYSSDYYVTVLGANEAIIALEPVPLLSVLATHGTCRFPATSTLPEQLLADGSLTPLAQNVVAHAAVAFSYMAAGRPMLAAAHLQAALTAPDLEPSVQGALRNQFGTAMLLLNRDDLALKEYVAVTEMASTAASAQVARAYIGVGSVALARRDWELAGNAFRDAIRLDPYAPTAYCGLGVLYTRERNVGQAMSAYYQAIALSPEESVPYALLAMGYELMGDAAKARDAYRVAAQHAGVNAGLQAAVLERAEAIVRNPPTAVPTATLRPLPTATPVPASQLYYVKSGDTLGTIADQFDVSVEDLLKINSIIHRDAIFVGQEIIIPEKD